jgi:hypothetical protein
VWWRIWKKTPKLLSVFGRHISWKVSQVNLRVVAKEIRRVSLAVSSKFCRKYVSNRAMYKTLTNKPTINQIHVGIKKKWESSGVEMVACAVSLILVRDNNLTQFVWNLPEPG